MNHSCENTSLQNASVENLQFPGLYLARGKYPQPRCHSHVNPPTCTPPVDQPAEESDAGLSAAGLSTSDYPKPDNQPPTQRFSVASPRTGLREATYQTYEPSSVPAGGLLLLPG